MRNDSLRLLDGEVDELAPDIGVVACRLLGVGDDHVDDDVLGWGPPFAVGRSALSLAVAGLLGGANASCCLVARLCTCDEDAAARSFLAGCSHRPASQASRRASLGR